MSEEADRFRIRARQCRELAKNAKDDLSRLTLTGMADELEAEANTIDAESAMQTGEKPQ